MDFPKDVIETQATHKIEELANKTLKIVHDIKSNDKKVSFDGELEIYKDPQKIKENLLGIIRVQIKGKIKKRKGPNKISFNGVSKRDLEIYKKQGGVYFFVVFIIIKDNEIIDRQVYGKQLHQLDLSYLLQKKNKTVTIQMYEITNYEDFYDNCVKFLVNKRRQNQLGQIQYDSTGTEPMIITTPENIVFDDRGLPLNDFYSYIKVDSSRVNTIIPEAIVNIEKIGKIGKRKIIKSGKVIFEGKILIEVSTHITTIEIDSIFRLEIIENTGKGKYSMLPLNNLNIEEELFNIIDELSKGGIFYIDNIKINVTPFKIGIKETKDIVNKLKDISCRYDNLIPLEAEIGHIEFSKQIKEMEGLIELLENYKFEIFNIQNNTYYKVQFGGKHILLFRNDDSIYNVYSNEFEKTIKVIIKETGTKLPILYTLTREMMVNVLNFDSNIIKKVIENDNFGRGSEEKWEKLNNLALELIASYDETQEKDLLELAEYILQNVLNEDNDKEFMNLINQAQIMKRKNELNEDVISLLLEKKEMLKEIDKEIASLYINVISGSKQEAMIRYKKLDNSSLELF
ncbi:hypothetical protein I0598_002578, partial [Staphylococcus pseudintermedius]|nr:hypothetical protein [Staphylococcus pseudintermedius]